MQSRPCCPYDIDSFFRRWTQVAFTRFFSEDDPKTEKNLGEKVTTREVSEAVLAWAVEGLVRLLKNNGRFTFTKSMEETRLQYERSTNPAKAFADDNLERNDEEHIKKDQAVKNYFDYCKKTDIPAQSEATFRER